jgi:hypothetical protein
LQLYRGAVMTYREFVLPNNPLLDDDSWRELVSHGGTPPPPPFTRSFYAETSVSDLIQQLEGESAKEEADYDDIEDLLSRVGSRATARDLPPLIPAMTPSNRNLEGFGEVIANLPWEPYQKQLIGLMGTDDSRLTLAVAHILVKRPEAVDAPLLLSSFSSRPPLTRRLDCAILSRLPQPNGAIRKSLLEALHDPAEGVHWQAALAIGTTGRNDDQSVAALEQTLNDPNELVVAEAVVSLAKLGATNAAPVLFARLQACMQSTNTTPEELERQTAAIMDETRLEGYAGGRLLDPDNLELRTGVTPEEAANARRRLAMRAPPPPLPLRTHPYRLVDALIEALGDLGYAPAAAELSKLRGGVYDAEAMGALNKLVPDRLTEELLATARDKQMDSYLREQALIALANLSATNRVRELVPLLDDPTPIVYSITLPGEEWRICDRAVETIAILLGWEPERPSAFIPPEQRAANLNRVREWARQAP